MGSTRIYELARDIGVPTAEVLRRAEMLSIDASSGLVELDDHEVALLEQSFAESPPPGNGAAPSSVSDSRLASRARPQPPVATSQPDYDFDDGPQSSRRNVTLPAALWRFRWAVVAAIVVGALGGLALSLAPITEVYRANTELFLADPSNIQDVDLVGQTAGSTRFQATQARFIESTAVAERTAELLGEGWTTQAVSAAVTATPSENSDTIIVSAVADEPIRAAQIADTVAEAYQQVVSERVQASARTTIDQLEESKLDLETRLREVDAALADDPTSASLTQERASVVAQLASINDRIQRIGVDLAFYGSGVRLVEPAEIPKAPEGPNVVQQTVLGAVLGLLAAAAFAWAWSYRSPSAEGRHDPAVVLGAPLLSEIPEYERTGTHGPIPMVEDPHSTVAEAYEFALSALGFALNGKKSATIVITSAVPGEGKTSTAVNLAAATTADGRTSLLIDADERAQGLSQLLGMTGNGKGLTDLAIDPDISIEDIVQHWKPDESTSVGFVPSGSRPQRTAGFFRSPGFVHAMGKLRGQADVTLVDSPPVLAVAETVDIAAQADGVIVVVEQGTPLRVLKEMRERLEMAGTPLYGYIFNKSIPVSPGSGYGYGRYGYGYGRYGKRHDE